jgi:hypothetical protein
MWRRWIPRRSARLSNVHGICNTKFVTYPCSKHRGIGNHGDPNQELMILRTNVEESKSRSSRRASCSELEDIKAVASLMAVRVVLRIFFTGQKYWWSSLRASKANVRTVHT